jgi:hypothetical protein
VEIRLPVLDAGGLRIPAIPLAAGFNRIRAELDGAAAALVGSTWAYGNVYDAQERPLG